MALTKEVKDEIKDKLNNDKFLKNLREFKKEVYDVCEKLESEKGLFWIRTIIQRNDIKTLDSVINKIENKRLEDTIKNANYSIDDITDLIGIKILCPYLSSSKEVGQWLIDKSGLTITPKNIEKAWKKYPSGYRGYHLSAEKSINIAGEMIYCEIQIKTMCQETWDAQTHDLSYKNKDSVSSELFKHICELSNILASVDAQGDIIKDQIQKEDKEKQRKRTAAAFAALSEANTIVQHLKSETGIDLMIESGLDERQIVAITSFNGKFYNNNTSKEFCIFLCSIALIADKKEHRSTALDFSKIFAQKNNNNIEGLSVKILIHCFLNKHKEIINDIKALIQQSEYISNPELKSNIIYVITDTIRADCDNDNELLQIAKKYYDEISSYITSLSDEESAGYLDTMGYFKIITGETTEDIEDGIALVNKAAKNAPINQMLIANASKPYHKLLAYKRLLELSRKN